jgi:hypothetical protein
MLMYIDMLAPALRFEQSIQARFGGEIFETCPLAETYFNDSLLQIENGKYRSQPSVRVYCQNRDGMSIPIGIEKTKRVPTTLMFEPIFMVDSHKPVEKGSIVSISKENRLRQIGQKINFGEQTELNPSSKQWSLECFEFTEESVILCPLRNSIWTFNRPLGLKAGSPVEAMFLNRDLESFQNVCAIAVEACIEPTILRMA